MSDTPMTDERIQEIAKQAARKYHHSEMDRHEGSLQNYIAQAITEALTAERSKNAKLREEVLEKAITEFQNQPLEQIDVFTIIKVLRAMKKKK